jgi:hypothetical protein
MADQINLDRPTLENHVKKWDGRVQDADDRLRSFAWSIDGKGHRADLSTEWKLKLGVEGYEPGANLNVSVNKVRDNLAQRTKAYGDGSQHLYEGLQNVIDAGDEALDFSQMSAEEFYSELPSS